MSLYNRDYWRDDRASGGAFRGARLQRSFLSATAWLLAINIVVFLLWQVIGNSEWFEDLFTSSADLAFRRWRLWTLVTSTFSHRETGHLFVNMLCLWFVGKPLEARLGSRNLLLLYLVGGAVASVAQTGSHWIAGMPQIRGLGASGAVMAMLVLFACYYPWSKFYIWGILPVPAIVLSALYILLDLAGTVNPNPGDHIGHVAHLGGAVVGALWWFADTRRLGFRKEPFQYLLKSQRKESPRFSVSDERLDFILEKVRHDGILSISDAERADLLRASEERRAAKTNVSPR